MAAESDEISRNIAPDPLEIENAARAWGVETEYWDIWGHQHHASTELETAILRSLGVDTSSSASLREAIDGREQRSSLAPLAPAIFQMCIRDSTYCDAGFAQGPRITGEFSL